MASSSHKGKVAVIGLGAYGLVTVKNLREEGFEVTGFERNAYIGGLWKYTTNPTQTSVLEGTICNISKQRGGYTDFPFPDDIPDYPTGAQVHKYLEDYADHFKLRPYFRLNTDVCQISRTEDDKAWLVVTKKANHQDGTDADETSQVFDKVVVTTGLFRKPVMPKISGLADFKGTVIHAQAFKDPTEFKGKNVVIVGLSNTAADIVADLATVGGVNKVYVSHRSGARVMLRYGPSGRPADHMATYKMMNTMKLLERISPTLKTKLFTSAVERTMRKTFPRIDPAWRLLPAPTLPYSVPIVNDHLINLLDTTTNPDKVKSNSTGLVYSAAGITTISGPRSLTLQDGSELTDIDAIICCTGYWLDYSFMAADVDPTRTDTPEYDAAPFGTSVHSYVRLYQGILSPKYATSLAFMGPYLIISAFVGADVVSQAIAQVFSGGYELAPQPERERWCEENYALNVWQAQLGRAPVGHLKMYQAERWLNEVCGNGMNEKLGWGLEGWKFWWYERELWNMMVNGIWTGSIYRVFDGRRKKWDGAREAIYKANQKSKKE